jgi:hypothetical protein
MGYPVRVGIRALPASLIGSLALLSACSLDSFRFKEPAIARISPETPEAAPGGDSTPGCLSMLNEYCDSLYQPGVEGNLIIQKKKGGSLRVLQGKTLNGFRQVFVEFARSKLRNRRHLPPDLQLILNAHQYFERLEQLLNRTPFEHMTLMDRVEAHEEESGISHTWDLAIRDTLIIRMSRRFQEYARTPADLQPPEVIHAEGMERKILLAQISSAIWKDHPNWKKVQTTFETLRKKTLLLIDTLPVAGELRKEWKERIASVRLVLPGSLPEIVDRDCSTTMMNAYYYTPLNVITVCAGDFNSEEILPTLAHELSHALDNDRSLHLFFKNSGISRSLETFNRNMCSPRPTNLSCEHWRDFKSRIPGMISELGSYRPNLPELQRCLKKDRDTETPGLEAVRRIATTTVRETIRELAAEDAFIRITQEKLPLNNGKRVENPSFMNPCLFLQTHWSDETLDSELSLLTAFAAEYRCSTESDSGLRLEKSIRATQVLFEGLLEGMIRSEGEFSDRKSMIAEGYSSSPAERFADFFGSRLIASQLVDSPSLWDRRMTFLAGNSWQCPGPSLSQAFPKESSVLRRYLLNAHTDGQDRRKESFSTPLREVLGCEKDFEWPECSLSGNSRDTP